jgi:hypothetical protein
MLKNFTLLFLLLTAVITSCETPQAEQKRILPTPTPVVRPFSIPDILYKYAGADSLVHPEKTWRIFSRAIWDTRDLNQPQK